MTQSKARRRVVRVLSKGQITIPSEFRDALGIGSETLLSVSVSGDHLEITPLRHGDEALRSYTERDIERFLKDDRLDEGTAKKVRDLLKSGKL